MGVVLVDGKGVNENISFDIKTREFVGVYRKNRMEKYTLADAMAAAAKGQLKCMLVKINSW